MNSFANAVIFYYLKRWGESLLCPDWPQRVSLESLHTRITLCPHHHQGEPAERGCGEEQSGVSHTVSYTALWIHVLPYGYQDMLSIYGRGPRHNHGRNRWLALLHRVLTRHRNKHKWLIMGYMHLNLFVNWRRCKNKHVLPSYLPLAKL